MTPTRHALETEWLHLTRDTLPPLAAARGWPVSADHCFQRILLDHGCGGRWYDHIPRRPAYVHAPDAVLARAVALAHAVIAGEVDLAALNDRSLAWRGKGQATRRSR
ncbi:GCN5-related N-acetyltransferase [Sphingomonas sp. 1P08PE]|uniref:GCN5-related N-acetyltransferase n=1 Tax=Sphingomonas sp. 1P08PE TaxID=554122 RepID=UPI0039A0C0DF